MRYTIEYTQMHHGIGILLVHNFHNFVDMLKFHVDCMQIAVPKKYFGILFLRDLGANAGNIWYHYLRCKETD